MEAPGTESQQLVTQDEDQENVGGASGGGGAGGGGGTHTHSLSPALSSSVHSNRAVQPTPPHGTTRIAYVSERRPNRINRRVGATFQVAGVGGTTSASAYNTSRQDAKQTQADLLRLLAEFSSPEVSKATQQLADIRQQQDDLARLHFKLGSDPDAPSKPASARETMARLVRSLELLSTSIEQLHNVSETETSNVPTSETENASASN